MHRRTTKRHVARPVPLPAGFMLFVLSALISFESAFAAPQNLRVHVNDNLVTINATNVMVRDLLTEISKHTGLKVVSNLPLDRTLSIDLDQRTLPKVLSRILRDENTILQSITNGDSQDYILWVIADGSSRSDVAANATLVIDPNATTTDLGLNDENPNVRFDAVMDLADGDSSAVLAQALADPEPEIREAAVFALAEVGDETSVHLIRQALSDPDRDVREVAEEMLMVLDDGER